MDNPLVGFWSLPPFTSPVNTSKPLTCQWTFPVETNGTTVFFNDWINDVYAIRIKHLTWLNTPIVNPASTTMLYLCCGDIYTGIGKKSGVFRRDPANANQITGMSRAIVASYNVAPIASGVPNYSGLNGEQQIIAIQKANFNKIDFYLETDLLNNINIDPTNRVSVTVEFFYSK